MNLKQPMTLPDIDRLAAAELKEIKDINGIKYWGHLNLPDTSYEYLRACISERCKGKSLQPILKVYPIAVTTFVIFMVRYKYDRNFWHLLSTELGIDNIPGPSQREIGSKILETFRKYGFNYDQVKDDQRKYVVPIIHQACLPPESCLDELFFAIKSDNRGYFDPQLFIEELISQKAYSIRKPMRNFLENFRDTDAIEYILNVRDAMLAVEQRGTVESRYEIQYQDWNEQEKAKTSVHGKANTEQHEIKPFLTFEEGRRGLCMVLPRKILTRDWIENARWTVLCDKKAVGVTCRVFGDDGKRYVDSITIPVYPAAEYTIFLRDAENENDTENLAKFDIPGIEDFVCFNERGAVINSEYLSIPLCSLVIKGTAAIEECRDINYTEQVYPMQCDEYRFYSVSVSGAGAFLKIKSPSKSVTLTARSKISMFLDGETLFSLPAGETNLFTRMPDLRLNLKDLAFRKDLEIRVGSKRIPVQCDGGDESVTLRLNQHFEADETRFGTYSVRLYHDGRFLRQTEFCYVPKIKSDYTCCLSWPKNGKIPRQRSFRFERKKDWDLSFENCKVERTENEYIVTCPENTGVLDGSLQSMREGLAFEAKFRLPLTPLLLEIMEADGAEPVNVYGSPLSLGLTEFTERERWLAVTAFDDFREKSYTVTLRNTDGIQQQETLRVSANGEGICRLSAFETTLRYCVLPALFEIRRADDSEHGIPFMIVTNQAGMQEYPVYARNLNAIAVMQDDAGKQTEFKRFGKEPFTYRVEENEWEEHAPYGLHRLRAELPAGIYSLTDSEPMSIFELEEDDSAKLSQDVPSFLVEQSDGADYPRESIHAILPQLFLLILRKRWALEQVSWVRDVLAGKIHLTKARELNDFEIELLAALGYIADSKIGKPRKKTITDFMKVISEDVLSGVDRTRIIRALTAMKCPQSVFDVCKANYSLFLFDPDESNMRPLSEETEPYSDSLALLMLLDTDAPLKDTLRREKFRSLIGKDALEDMLGVHSKDRDAADAAVRKFLNDEKSEDIHVNLSSEISGQMQPLEEMIEVKWNKIIFHIEKEPTTGIYFDQIRFCAQYVNWYRSNHSYDWHMLPGTRERMLKLVNEQTMKNIEESIARLRRNTKQWEMFGGDDRDGGGSYYKAIQARFPNQPHISFSVPSLPRYFYLQGLAAYFSRILGSDEDSVFIRETGNRFLAGAYEISPKMVRRDILMASTYIYLKKKEEELCR